MIYNKALVSSKQKEVIKSISDLLEVLSEIEIDGGGNNGEITLEDGSVMTLSLASDKDRNSSHIHNLSVTNARLNLDITVREQDDVIRLVKREPKKIVIKLKKKDSQ